MLFKVIEKFIVSRRKLESAPYWLINKAVMREIEDGWKDAFFEDDERLVPAYANVICSLIIYKMKIWRKAFEKAKGQTMSSRKQG